MKAQLLGVASIFFVIFFLLTGCSGGSSDVVEQSNLVVSEEGVPITDTGNNDFQEELQIVSLKTVTINNEQIVDVVLDKNATLEVEYGEDTSYGMVVKDNHLSIHHKIKLLDISTDIVYHFRVNVKDEFGKNISSKDYIFKILDLSDPLNAIKNLMDDASVGKTNVTYATAGDSKRDGFIAGQQILYPEELVKYNIKYSHNSKSGMRAEQWINQPDTVPGLAKLVKEATGNGGDLTIVEYSLGANDYNHYRSAHNGATEAEIHDGIKPLIKTGITKILEALPNATIFLTNPTGSERSAIKQIYRELSLELNLPLIESPLDALRDNPQTRVKYLADTIHPNTFGAMRILHNILKQITGIKSRHLAEWNEDLYSDTSSKDGVNLAEGAVIDHRLRIFDNFYSNGDTRRSITIPVIGGSILKVKHPGNYNSTMPLGADGKGVLSAIGQPSKSSSRRDLATLRDSADNSTIFKYVYVPQKATSIVINMSTQGTTFDDAIVNTPIVVEYATTAEIAQYLPSEANIDDGLNTE